MLVGRQSEQDDGWPTNQYLILIASQPGMLVACQPVLAFTPEDLENPFLDLSQLIGVTEKTINDYYILLLKTVLL
jgi:hypothetical protein